MKQRANRRYQVHAYSCGTDRQMLANKQGVKWEAWGAKEIKLYNNNWLSWAISTWNVEACKQTTQHHSTGRALNLLDYVEEKNNAEGYKIIWKHHRSHGRRDDMNSSGLHVDRGAPTYLYKFNQRQRGKAKKKSPSKCRRFLVWIKTREPNTLPRFFSVHTPWQTKFILPMTFPNGSYFRSWPWCRNLVDTLRRGEFKFAELRGPWMRLAVYGRPEDMW